MHGTSDARSVSHVSWECPAYNSLRSNFFVALQGKLGDGFEHSNCTIVSQRHPIFWVVSCGRINLVLCSTFLRVLFWIFG